MTVPGSVVCDHCLCIVDGLYYDYDFEGKTYYYCNPTCAVHGMQRHNIDEYDRIRKRIGHVHGTGPQGTTLIH